MIVSEKAGMGTGDACKYCGNVWNEIASNGHVRIQRYIKAHKKITLKYEIRSSSELH